MLKIFKFFIVLLAIFIILLNCNYVFADVNMNLSSNSTNTASTNTASTNSAQTTTFTSIGTSSSDLQLNNILNVVLIVVGVLLLLLGIAILIRLKS